MRNLKVDFNGEDFLDSVGIANAKLIRSIIRKDKSWTMFVVGKEREGKTTLDTVWLSIIDPTLCLDRVVFPTRELKKAIHKLPEQCYKAVEHDEGAETWLSMDSSSSDSKDMVKYMMETGYKNICLGINLPDVSMIQRYMKSHRIDCILRVMRRGIYAFYSAMRVKEIRFDKQNKRVIWPRPNYVGWWKDPKTPFMRAIAVKKMVHLGHKEEDPRVAKERDKMERLKRHTLTTRQAAEMCGMKTGTFLVQAIRGDLKRKYGIKGFLLGRERRFFVSDIKRMSRLRVSGAPDNIERKIEEEERLAERETTSGRM